MNSLIDWLLSGDVSIQYMTHKYWLNKPSQEIIELRNRIATEGWGKAFLDARKATGHWGREDAEEFLLIIDYTNQINLVRSLTKDGRCCHSHPDGGIL